MGEFSYTPSEYTSEAYGEESFSTGYQSYEPGYDPNQGQGYGEAPLPAAGGYQDEIRALIPENVPMLGAILMEQGVVSHDALMVALDRQAETGDSLVQVLLDEGLAAPDQLVMALQTRGHYR